VNQKKLKKAEKTALKSETHFSKNIFLTFTAPSSPADATH
jgi:hypothetical protein